MRVHASNATGIHEGWRAGAGGDFGDPELSDAQRDGGDGCGRGEREEAGSAVSAGRGGWAEHCGSVPGEKLLCDAADDCDSRERGAGPGWVLRAASGDERVEAAV